MSNYPGYGGTPFINPDGKNIEALIGLNGEPLPFELMVSMRLLPGYEIVDQYGQNPLITASSDPEDVWEGGGLYTYDAFGTAPIVSIASTDDNDTQEILIKGLDIGGNFVEQIKALQGTTRVALTTPLWRVFSLENEADEGGDIVGNVFVYTGTGTVPGLGDPEVRAVILDGNNQTQMALYTIPKGYFGFLWRGEIGLKYSGTVGSGTNFATAVYRSRRFGKVFKTKKTINIISAATSNYVDLRSFPDIIPALTDIKITATEVSDDIGVWASFDILLIDENKFDPAFVAAVQPYGG
jgi:hypothetical protein